VLAILVGIEKNGGMTVGKTPKQADLLRGSAAIVGDRVAPDSIYGFLHREGHRIFPDDFFADMYSTKGRRSVPPQVVATVMVLQRLLGRSDREAVEAFAFDVRWKYAAGGLDVDYPDFSHTVLVDMRARLAASEMPRRIFEAVLEAAREAGLVGYRRVLDSTPLYDAVATMDTVTLIRSAIRQLLAAADDELEAELRAQLSSGDDYASSAKPHIDWDDAAAREALIDSRAKDGFLCLAMLDGRTLDPPVAQAAELLATVLGQDLEEGDDGVFRIARRVAADRVVSTVDPDARHGHKTQAKGFDGYKGHVAEDPDSEIIVDTKVTPGNAADGSVAEDLIDDLVEDYEDAQDSDDDLGEDRPRPTVYGDGAYGGGEFQEFLDDHDIESRCKTQPPSPPPGGLFSKNRFDINLADDTVSCPNGVTVTIRRNDSGGGTASFGAACRACPLRSARARRPDGRSRSARTKTPSPRPVPRNKTRTGEPTTEQPDPKSNANSDTSCPAATADDERESAASPKSTPTSTSLPPPSTPRDSRNTASAQHRQDGPPQPHDRPGGTHPGDLNPRSASPLPNHRSRTRHVHRT
jgi:hypothetical protein